MWIKVAIALAYGTVSFGITVINKVVLTTYQFPSYQFLGVCQIIATVVLVGIAGLLGVVKIPRFTWHVVGRIFPLPILFMGNLITGLGATQKINLPMFTVLRRFSILMTVIGECVLLRKQVGFSEYLSVFLMILGAVVAASHDLSFTAFGYSMIMFNNLCTALGNVYQKKKADAKDLGEFGILFYNSLLTFFPATVILHLTDDVQAIISSSCWGDKFFVLFFLLSSVMGFLLMYTTMLSNIYISPTSTTVIGTLKNIFTAYVGMFIGGDYLFNWYNFIGLNVSLIGGLLHSCKAFDCSLAACWKKCCCFCNSPLVHETSASHSQPMKQLLDSEMFVLSVEKPQFS